MLSGVFNECMQEIVSFIPVLSCGQCGVESCCKRFDVNYAAFGVALSIMYYFIKCLVNKEI